MTERKNFPITNVENTSKDLLYSEYIKTTAVEHALQAVENKAKEKPVMKFIRSSVLAKISKRLPILESDLKLKENSNTKCDIEDIKDGESYVEMNVAVLEDLVNSDSQKSFEVNCEKSDRSSTGCNFSCNEDISDDDSESVKQNVVIKEYFKSEENYTLNNNNCLND